MSIFRKSLVSCVVLAGIAVTACQPDPGKKTDEAEAMTPPPKISLEDFFKNPDKTSYQISPDGSHYSFMAPYADRLNVYIQKVGEDSATRITNQTDRDIAGYFWANDSRILYLRDDGGNEDFYLMAVNIDGSNEAALTKEEGVRTQIIDDLEDIEDYVIVGLNKRDARIYDPYRLNINTGEMEMVAENPGNISSWMTDHEGKIRIAITTDGVNTTLLYRDTEGDEFKPVITTSFKESFNPYFFDFDNGSTVYGSSNLNRDKSAIVKFDLNTGEELEVLFEDADNDVTGLSYSDGRKVLTTATWTAAKRKRHFFDETVKGWYSRLESEFPGVEVAITSLNKAEDKMMVRTYSDKTRGAYYFYDTQTDQITHLVDVSPWLDENNMADMKPITYTSRDGLTIHGYLTLPKGVEAKNLPVVVNPHGGPWARDYWGFNPEIQFLANRGYAVLQMNFRGSTSYGREFWEASFKQWGQTMQDDVSDGAKWLIEQGIADPERIAIYGGSYGGYATLAGLTFTPDLYACGVDYVGVSNLFTFMETIPPYWEQYLEMLYEMVGHPENDSAMLAAYSPNLHADQIKAPLFIAQGANDPRVKKSESDQMVEAMKARGVDVEYLVKDNEGHGFRNQENRFEFYESMHQFLNKHIGTPEKVEASL
ncbi:MAG: S9 family peptidase, partial [Bacteroidota bacterium]